jgi:hypothetical protein
MLKSILFVAALIGLSLAFGALVLPGRRRRGADRDAGGTGAHAEVAALLHELAFGVPLHLPKLMQAVNDEDVSQRELAVLIAQDPALAAAGFAGPGCERIWARLAGQLATAESSARARTHAER